MLWAGDAGAQGISRDAENKMIRCDSEEFSKYVCLTYTDLENLLSCGGVK